MKINGQECIVGMSVSGVSKILGLNPNQTWYLLKRGHLTARKSGNTLLVDPDSVRSYLARKEAEADSLAG